MRTWGALATALGATALGMRPLHAVVLRNVWSPWLRRGRRKTFSVQGVLANPALAEMSAKAQPRTHGSANLQPQTSISSTWCHMCPHIPLSRSDELGVGICTLRRQLLKRERIHKKDALQPSMEATSLSPWRCISFATGSGTGATSPRCCLHSETFTIDSIDVLDE